MNLVRFSTHRWDCFGGKGKTPPTKLCSLKELSNLLCVFDEHECWHGHQDSFQCIHLQTLVLRILSKPSPTLLQFDRTKSYRASNGLGIQSARRETYPTQLKGLLALRQVCRKDFWTRSLSWWYDRVAQKSRPSSRLLAKLRNRRVTRFQLYVSPFLRYGEKSLATTLSCCSLSKYWVCLEVLRSRLVYLE